MVELRARRVRVFRVLTAAAIVLASGGCAGDGTSTPASERPTATVGGDAGVPAEGGLSVAEASASTLAGPLAVEGFIVANPIETRLCEALMESYPPQCGGASLLIEGVALHDVPLQREGDVAWTDTPVTLVGEVDAGTLRVTATSR